VNYIQSPLRPLHTAHLLRKSGIDLADSTVLKNGAATKEMCMAKTERNHSRVAVSWPAAILSKQGAIAAEVKNVSLSGVLIWINEVPGSNGNYYLAILIPEHNYTILTRVEPIRLEIHENEPKLIYSLGVRFVDISVEDLRFLVERVLR